MTTKTKVAKLTAEEAERMSRSERAAKVASEARTSEGYQLPAWAWLEAYDRAYKETE